MQLVLLFISGIQLVSGSGKFSYLYKRGNTCSSLNACTGGNTTEEENPTPQRKPRFSEHCDIIDHPPIVIDRITDLSLIPATPYPENPSREYPRGIKTTGDRDNTIWHSIDGPILIQNDKAAQWALYSRRNGVRAPLPEHRYAYRASKGYEKLIPAPEFFNLSHAPSGNSGWGPIVGPIQSKDGTSVHWFRIRQNIRDALSPTFEQYDEFINNMEPMRALLKEQYICGT